MRRRRSGVQAGLSPGTNSRFAIPLSEADTYVPRQAPGARSIAVDTPAGGRGGRVTDSSDSALTIEDHLCVLRPADTVLEAETTQGVAGVDDVVEQLSGSSQTRGRRILLASKAYVAAGQGDCDGLGSAMRAQLLERFRNVPLHGRL